MSSLASTLRRMGSVWRNHGARGIFDRLVGRLRPRKEGEPNAGEQKWLEAQQPLSPEAYRARIDAFSFQPTISILCPVCDPPLRYLEELVRSVEEQVYSEWELCIADDSSEKEEVRNYLKELSSREGRVKLCSRQTRGHIAAASQSALELASGEYVALLDHDDLLPRHSLFHIVEALQGDTKPQIIYTDEAKVDEEGALFEPSVKPDWSPSYFRSFMYVGHLTVYERDLVTRVGGFREGFEGSQDYDLFLRSYSYADRITHIPRILYYWRSHSASVAKDIDSKQYAFDSASKALEEHLLSLELGEQLELEQGPYAGTVRYNAKERLNCSFVEWTEGESSGDLLAKIKGVESEYLFLSVAGTGELDEDELSSLLACLFFPDVLAVMPLLVNRGKTEVEAAGWSKLPRGFSPNLQGSSLLRGGPGHRLYVPHEVDAVSLGAIVIRKSHSLELLSSIEGASLLREVDIESRLPEPTSLVLQPMVKVPISPEQANSFLSVNGAARHYPIGYSPKEANFQFAS